RTGGGRGGRGGEDAGRTDEERGHLAATQSTTFTPVPPASGSRGGRVEEVAGDVDHHLGVAGGVVERDGARRRELHHHEVRDGLAADEVQVRRDGAGRVGEGGEGARLRRLRDGDVRDERARRRGRDAGAARDAEERGRL